MVRLLTGPLAGVLLLQGPKLFSALTARGAVDEPADDIDEQLENSGILDDDNTAAPGGAPEGCEHQDKDVRSNCRRLKSRSQSMCSNVWKSMMMEKAQCHVDKAKGTTCGLASLKKDMTNMIFPGGDTACLTGAPYRFQVIPRDPEKLVISFQGGGNCMNKKSIEWGFCCDQPIPAEHEGLYANQKRMPESVFADHTVLHILFCSGDTHMGNSTKPYKVGRNQVKQKGLVNAMAAVEWALENMRRPKSLIIHGSSAGSYAVQSFAATFLHDDYFGSSGKRMVIMDSGIGNYKTTTMARVLDAGDHGEHCASFKYFSSHVLNMCILKKLTYHVLLRDTIRAYPNIPFVSIDSKEDEILKAFYSVMESGPGVRVQLSSAEYYRRVVKKLEHFAQFPNFAAFLANGKQHQFLLKDHTMKLYNSGKKGQDGAVQLLPWLKAIYNGQCGAGDWECFGSRTEAVTSMTSSFCPMEFDKLTMKMPSCTAEP